MKVIVVGAGMAGLAAAVGLTQDGHEVTVLERAEEISQAGAGIGVMPNGIRALDRLALGDAVRAHFVPGDGDGTTRDRGGRALLRVRDAEKATPAVDPIVALPRRTLAGILRDALPEGTVKSPVHVTSVDAASGSVVSTTETMHADLIVAADGARSRVRRILFPGHPGLKPSGQHAAQAIVPDFTQDVSPIIGEMLDHRSGGRFGTLPMADGSIYWYALWDSRQQVPSDPSSLLRWLRYDRAEWHPAVGDLLSATDPERIHVRETASLARPLPSLTVGRVALLGDAAHAMTPDLGQGASQAFEDAVALIDAIRTSQHDVPVALRRYDAERRARTARMILLSRLTGRLSSLRGVAGATRDAVMRLMPAMPA
ncbi:FAD-dependent oxidoreductase [Rhodococcus sp. SJ-2]